MFFSDGFFARRSSQVWLKLNPASCNFPQVPKSLKLARPGTSFIIIRRPICKTSSLSTYSIWTKYSVLKTLPSSPSFLFDEFPGSTARLPCRSRLISPCPDFTWFTNEPSPKPDAITSIFRTHLAGHSPVPKIYLISAHKSLWFSIAIRSGWSMNGWSMKWRKSKALTI